MSHSVAITSIRLLAVKGRLKSAFGCIREKAVHFEVAAAVARKMQLMAATNYVLRNHE